MRIIMLAMAMAFFLSVSAEAAHNPQPGKAGRDVPQLELDEDALLDNALRRLKNQIRQQNPAAMGLDSITRDNLAVVQKEPIKAGDAQLWMVKIRYSMLPLAGADDDKTFDATMTVDPAGSWQYADVTEIVSGKSAFTMAMRELNKAELPKDFGTPLAKGKGSSSVVFVTDPFCPYCRSQYSWLKANIDSIGELKIFHLPMPNLHPSATLACAVMAFAHDQLKQDEYVKLVDWVYTGMEEKLNPKRDQQTKQLIPPTQEEELSILKTMIAQFPALAKDRDLETLYAFLKKTYVGLITRESEMASERYGLRATPSTFVDGYLVYGFKKADLEQLILGK